MEQSLKEKIGQMNGLGLDIAAFFDKHEDIGQQLTFEESEFIYGVADGLCEDYVMRTLEGKCSLKQFLTPVEDLEAYVDERISELIKVQQKYCTQPVI